MCHFLLCFKSGAHAPLMRKLASDTTKTHFISLVQLPKRKSTLKCIYLRTPHIVHHLHGLMIPVMTHFEMDKSIFRKYIVQSDILVH